MLVAQAFGAPVCSPWLRENPPKKVLDVGCGTGYWSAMVHDYFSKRAHSDISFTGLDIHPFAPDGLFKEQGMNWRYAHHDLRKLPLPFDDEEFDMVFVKDMGLAIQDGVLQQKLMDEYLRLLKPGGVLEAWESDHTIRTLLPLAAPLAAADPDDEYLEQAEVMGTYPIGATTPFAMPHNEFLSEYSNWVLKALEKRNLSPHPCTKIGPMFLQETDDLGDIGSRRLAIPLGEVRWEREGIGGAALPAGGKQTRRQSFTKGTGIARGKEREADKKVLTMPQAALRQTALLTVVQMIENMEIVLKEASGKGQDEWDRWWASMMTNLLEQNGSTWGECLEVGAWWGKKHS
jgi:SAM-dependent methyltransferase